jgi:hypothetical protein
MPQPTDIFNQQATNRLRMALAVQSGRMSEAMASQIAPGWETAVTPAKSGSPGGPGWERVDPGATGATSGIVVGDIWRKAIPGGDPLAAVYDPGAAPVPPVLPQQTPGAASPVPPPPRSTPAPAPAPALVPPPAPVPVAPAPSVPPFPSVVAPSLPTVPEILPIPGLPTPSPFGPMPTSRSTASPTRLPSRPSLASASTLEGGSGGSTPFPGRAGGRLREARSAILDPVKRRALRRAIS